MTLFRRLVVLMTLALAAAPASAQTIDADRDRARSMLRNIEKELRRHYHDPTFGGIELEDLFEQAGAQVAGAESEAQISGILVKTLLSLDDSHTLFIPPPTSYSVDYGFEMAMVGERCFVVAVQPDSPAAEDGLEPGCAVHAIEGVRPTRENLWTVDYALNVARPRQKVRMVLEYPGGAVAERIVRARVGPQRQFRDVTDWAETIALRRVARGVRPLRWQTIGERVTAVKLTTFSVGKSVIDGAMERARKREALILDLRGNAGGNVEILRRLLGYLFDRKVSVGTRRTRKKVEPIETKRHSRNDVYSGRLVVLVDSRSASAAEATARVVQLEERGSVLGDRTAGAVMESRHRFYRQGHKYRFLLYGLSITEADVVMSDGGRLEKVGVSPDEVILPTAEDLAAGRDPVLARAAQLLGEDLDPVQAGALFPREWR